MSGQLLKALVVQGDEEDLRLLDVALSEGGFEPVIANVSTVKGLRDALVAGDWDVVIHDHALSELDCARALETVQELCPDLPFIVLSDGYSEQAVVDALDAGAEDFIHKRQMSRLMPVLRRELRRQDARLKLISALQSARREMRSMMQRAALTQNGHDRAPESWGRAGTTEFENELYRAFEQEEFFLVYQPQFNIRCRQRIGVEALLRWRHPQRGIISPAVFIPALEGTGLIVPVGDWVVLAACRQAAEWRRAGWAGARVAVNVAMPQFERGRIAERVASALAETGLPAEALELEITESIAMNDHDQVVSALSELRAQGIGLAIDDFGTGYSSLAYLKYFPVDRLKIDQAFIQGIDADPRDRAIVKTTISMARELGLDVVAEGVETQAHLDFLSTHGCETAQGYYLGRPVPASGVALEA